MKRVLASIVTISVIAVFAWYYVQGARSGGSAVDTLIVPPDVAPAPARLAVTRETYEFDREADNVELEPLDLSLSCGEEFGTDECLDAADTWIRGRSATMAGWPGHSGRTWGEVFGDFKGQVDKLERSMSVPACDVSEWRPELVDQCAGWESHNMAVAIRACLQPPENASWRRHLLEKHGETDIVAIRSAMQEEAEERVETAWLRRECGRTWLPMRGRLAGVVGEAEGSLWVGPAYGERAALLGDRAAAKQYVHNKTLLDVVRVYGHMVIVDFSDEGAVARARGADLSTRIVIDRIVERDPAIGYDLLGDFEMERVPQIQSRDQYAEGFSPDYWVARAERAAAFKLTALRLQGVTQHVSLESLAEHDVDWITISDLIGEDVYSVSYRVDEILAGR